MVAIISGNGLGLLGSSLGRFGAAGAIGTAAHGRGAEQVYVNAANGNLVLRQRDEVLAGLGGGIEALRTYNSGGIEDGDNDDNWRIGLYRQLKSLTGTIGTVGSSITRVDGDGHESVYEYDSASQSYVSADDGGPTDRLTQSGSTWTWTDGATGNTETFNWYAAAGCGMLSEQSDTSGNVVNYIYNGTLLSQVVTTTADGCTESVNLEYQDNNLMSVSITDQDGVLQTRTRYGYDQDNRLVSVKVDLTPDDNSIEDGQYYETSYTYDGDSHRLATLRQMDGSGLDFTYVTADGTVRLATVTDIAHQTVTTFDYSGGPGKTTISDNLGHAIVLDSDGSGRLLDARLDLASAAPGGATEPVALTATYVYRDDGRVASVTDGAGNVTEFDYDAAGNCILQQDGALRMLERSYGAHNEVLSETVSVPGQAGSAHTTRFVYDSQRHLRFMVSAEGRVTEYRYNSTGQRSAAIEVAGTSYPLATTPDPDVAQLTDWMATIADSELVRTDYAYDFRGLLSQTTRRAQGAAPAAPDVVIDYVYDQRGRLLATVPAGTRGTSYTYDGLGRVLTTSDVVRGTSVSNYDDRQRVTVFTNADGLESVYTYGAGGELLSVLTGAQLTSQEYDAQGRARLVTDPMGGRSMMLYDAGGRLVGRIDAEGALTEYRYTANGKLTSTIAYASKLDSAALATLVDTSGAATPLLLAEFDEAAMAALRPAPMESIGSTLAGLGNRISYFLYDELGRLSMAIDPDGYAVGHQYDARGNETACIAYQEVIGPITIDAATKADQIMVSRSAGEHVTRSVYDADGLLLASIDAEGYVVEYQRDAAGRVIHQVRFATPAAIVFGSTPLTLDAAAYALLRPSVNAADQHTYRRYDGAGQLIAELNAEGYLTEYQYLNGHVSRTTRHAGQILGDPLDMTLDDMRAQADGIDPYTGAATGTPAQWNTYSYYDTGLLKTEVSSVGGLTTSYAYDQSGRLLNTTRADGIDPNRVTRNEYDEYGRLKKVVDGVNHATWLAYDDNNRLARQTDGNGNVSRYYYDQMGRLVVSVDAAGGLAETEYNGFGEAVTTKRHSAQASGVQLAGLTGGAISDAVRLLIASLSNAATDAVTTQTYSRRGQVESRTDALGHASTFSYDGFGQLTLGQTAAQNGGVVATRYGYDRRGLRTSTVADANALAATAAVTYDAFGRVVQTVDARHGVHRTSYDRLGRVVQTKNALNAMVVFGYDGFDRKLSQTDESGRTTYFDFDTAGRLTIAHDAYGTTVSSQYNGFGELVRVTENYLYSTAYTRDQNGRITRTTDGAGNVSTTTYDGVGAVATTTDANGVVTRYDYDAANRLTTVTLDPAVAGQTGHLNLSTTYQYDGQGRKLRTTGPDGAVTSVEFDKNGQVTATVSGSGAATLRTEYSYDVSGQVLQVTQGAGSANPVVTRYEYDALGRRVSETLAPNGAALNTSYTYDKSGNMVAKRDANGKLWRYAYDAQNRLTLTIDPLAAVVRTDYDALGRVTAVTEFALALGTALPSVAAMAAADDWSAGLAMPATSTSDRTTRTVYVDAAGGRKVYQIGADNHVVLSQYDQVGNLKLVTRYASTSWSIAGGTVTVASTPGQDRLEAMVYDGAKRVVGRIDGYVDANGNPHGQVTGYRYDAAGHLMETTRYLGELNPLLANASSIAALNKAGARETRQLFDQAGRPSASVDETGAVQTMRYDAAGRVLRTVRHAGRVATGLSDADLATAIAGLGTGDARTDDVLYDALGRVAYRIDARGYVSGYGYDANGNVLSVKSYASPIGWPTGAPLSVGALQQLLVNDTADRLESSVYDAVNRLSASVGASGQVTAYAYDGLGRVVKTTAYASMIAPGLSGPALNSALAALYASTSAAASAQVTRRYYDADGNVQYDVDGTLGVTEYVCNSFGERSLTVQHSDRATLNADGSLTLPGASNPLDRRTAHVVDAGNRRVYDVMPDGSVTLTQSNPFGEVTSVTTVGGSLADWADGAALPTVGELDTLVASATAASRVSRRQFDVFGRLTLEADAAGNATAYTYNALGELSATVRYARAGTTATNGSYVPPAADAGQDRRTMQLYDRATDRRYSVGADGRVTVEQLDAAGHTVVLTESSASVAGWEAGTNAGQDAASLQLLIDADSNKRVTRSVYNQAGLLAYSVDATGKVTGYTYNGVGELVTTVRFANPAATGSGGAFVAPQRDPGDERSARLFDAATDQSYEVAADGRVRVTTYDAFGNTARIADLPGYLTGWLGGTADPALSDLRTFVALAPASNTTSQLFDRAGRLQYLIDPMGNATGYAYDAMSQLTVVTHYARPGTLTGAGFTPQPDGADRRTGVLLDKANRRRYDVAADGRVSVTEFDRFGQTTSVTEVAQTLDGWASGAKASLALAELDSLVDANAADNRIRRQVFDKAGHLIVSIDAQGYVTAFSFDPFGQPTGSTRFVQRNGSFAADGSYALPSAGPTDRHTARVDDRQNDCYYEVAVDGSVVKTELDKFGRAVTVTAVAAAVSGWATGATTTVTLTGLQQLVSDNAGANQVSHQVHDAAGRLLYAIDAHRIVTGYVYNDLGDLAGSTVFATPVDTSNFDSATFTAPGANPAADRRSAQMVDRSRHAIYEVSADGTLSVTRLDPFGRAVCVTTLAAPVPGWVSGSTTTLEQASLPDPLAAAGDAANRSVRTSYDRAGRVQFVVDPMGNATGYAYNAQGEVTVTTRYANPGSFDGDTFVPQADQLNDRRSAHLADLVNGRSYDVAADGSVRLTELDAFGQPVRVTELGLVLPDWASGVDTSLNLSGLQALVAFSAKHISHKAFDAAGRLLYEADPADHVTGYTYDAFGALTATTHYVDRGQLVDGDYVYPSAPSASDRRSARLEDRANRLVYDVAADGRVRVTRTDTFGKLRSVTECGAVVAGWATGDVMSVELGTLQTLVAANASVNLVTRHVYQSSGRLRYSVDPQNVVTEYAYDALGEQTGSTVYARPGSFNDDSYVADPSPATDRHTARYIDRGRHAIYEVSADGVLRVSRLDAFGQVVCVTTVATPIAGWAAGTTTSLDPATLPDPLVAAADSANHSVRTAYDSNGRAAYVVDAMGNATGYAYDIDGAVAVTTRYARSGAFNGDVFTPQADPVNDRRTARVSDRVNDLVYDVAADGSVRVTSLNPFGQTVATTEVGGLLANWAGSSSTSATLQNLRALVSASANRVARNVYGAAGQLLYAIGPSGNVTGYGYDADGQVSTVTEVAAPVSGWPGCAGAAYTIAALDQLAAGSAATNRVSQTVRDKGGRVLFASDGAGHVTGHTYSADGRTQTTTLYANPGTFSSVNGTLGYTPAPGAQDHHTAQVRDPVARKTYTVSAGGQVSVEQTDVYGQLLSVTRIGQLLDGWADGSNADVSIGRLQAHESANAGSSTVTARNVYDIGGRLLASVNALDMVDWFEFDNFGNRIRQIHYGAQASVHGLGGAALSSALAAVHASATANSAAHVSMAVYDKADRLTASIDARGYVTRLVRNAFGEVADTVKYGSGVVPGQGDPMLTTQLGYLYTSSTVVAQHATAVTDPQGRVVYEVDALGYVTHRSYDSGGRVSVVTQYATAYAGARSDITAAALDAWRAGHASVDDRTSKTVYSQNLQEKVEIDAERFATRYVYDSFGRCVSRSQWPLRLNGSVSLNTITQPSDMSPYWDGMQSQNQQTLPLTVVTTQFDKAGNATRVVMTVSATESIAIVNTYDAFNRLIDSTEAADSATDAVTTHRVYDIAGRLIEKTVGWNGGANGAVATERYAYDDVARTRTVFNARGIALAESNTDWARAERAAMHLPSDLNQLSAAERAGLAATLLPVGAVTTTSDELGQTVRTSVRDEQGQEIVTSTLLYDGFGNVIRTTDANGNASYAKYDELNRKILEIDAVGHATTTQYDGFGSVHVIGRLQALVTGVTIVTQPSGVPGVSVPTLVYTNGADDYTVIEHDLLNQQQSITQGAVTGASDKTATLTYNAFGETQTRTTLSATWTYSYDHLGRVKTETLPLQELGAAARYVTNRYDYDAHGNKILAVEAEGLPEQRSTRYGYDLANRLISKTGGPVNVYRAGSVNAVIGVNVTETYAYDQRGNLICTTDANNNKVRQYYDALDRKIGEVSKVNMLSTWSFDPTGHAVSVTVYGSAVTAPADGRTLPQAPADKRNTELRYDYAGRLIESTVRNLLLGEYDSSTSGGAGYVCFQGDVTNRTVYDKMGNPIKQIDPRGNASYRYYDALNREIWKVDAAGYVTQTAYSATERTRTEYAGAPIVATDRTQPADLAALTAARTFRRTVEQINVRGDVVRRTESVSATLSAVTSYHYNGLGLVDQIVNPGTDYGSSGATRSGQTMRYDAQGRKVAQQTTTWKWNLQIDPDSQAANQVVAEQETDTYYDGVGNASSSTQLALGRGGANRVISNHYDAMGRLDYQTDGVGQLTRYGYDDAGNRTWMQKGGYDIDGNPVWEGQSTEYNAAGQITRITTYSSLYGIEWSALAVKENNYNGYGEVIGKSDHGPGQTSAPWTEFFDYDALGRIWRTNTGDGVTKIQLYDAAGNATLTLQSAGTLDLHTTAHSALSTLATMAGSSGLQGMSLKMALYDARNLVLRTMTPRGDVGSVMNAIAANLQSISGAADVTASHAIDGVGTVSGAGPVLTVAGQPAGASHVLLGYRLCGTADPYVFLPVLTSSGGGFPANLSQPPFTGGASYEYQYIATDAAGTVLNRGAGTVRLGSSGNLTLMNQAQRVGGNGFGMAVNSGGTTSLVFFDTGRLSAVGTAAQGASAVLRYRAADSNFWYSAALTAGAGLSSSVGASFRWTPPAELAAGTYQYELSVLDANGVPVDAAGGSFRKGENTQLLAYADQPDTLQAIRRGTQSYLAPAASHAVAGYGYINGARVNGQDFVLIGAQPPGATKMMLGFRVAGSSDAFAFPPLLVAAADSSEQYSISTALFSAGTLYEYRYLALAADGSLLNVGSGQLYRTSYGTLNTYSDTSMSGANGAALAVTCNGVKRIDFFDQGRKGAVPLAPIGASATLRYRSVGTSAWREVSLAGTAGLSMAVAGTFSWIVPSGESGQYQYELTAYDNGGNVANTASGTMQLGTSVQVLSYVPQAVVSQVMNQGALLQFAGAGAGATRPSAGVVFGLGGAGGGPIPVTLHGWQHTVLYPALPADGYWDYYGNYYERSPASPALTVINSDLVTVTVDLSQFSVQSGVVLGDNNYQLDFCAADGTVTQTVANVGATVVDVPVNQSAPAASQLRLSRRQLSEDGSVTTILLGSCQLPNMWASDGVHETLEGETAGVTAQTLQAALSVPATASKLLLAGQPAGTDRVVFGYRAAGNGEFIMVDGLPTFNNRRSDFVFDIGQYALPPGASGSAAALDYDYQYLALAADGTVLGSGSGQLHRDNTTQTVTVSQDGVPTAVPGLAVPTNRQAARRISFFDQGAGATYVNSTLRYRVAGTGAWLTGTLDDVNCSNPAIRGSLSWNPAGLAAGTYEFELTTRNGQSKPLTRVGGTAQIGAAYKVLSYASIADLPGRMRIDNLPGATRTVRLSMPAVPGASPVLLSADPLDPALFVYDTTVHPAGTYAYQIDALDANGNLLSQSCGTLSLGATCRQLSGALSFSRELPDTYGPSGATSFNWKLGRLDAALINSVAQVYDAFGNLVSQTDANGNVSTQTFDDRGRVLLTYGAAYDSVNASGTQSVNYGVTSFTYRLDGALQSKTVGAEPGFAGYTTTYNYHNAFDKDGNRVLSSEDNYSCGGGYVTFGINAFGERTGRTDQIGRTSSWTFDNAGRVTEAVVNGDRHLYEYDISGRQNGHTRKIWLEDGSLVTVPKERTKYDALGRVIEFIRGTSYVGGASSSTVTSYTYIAPTAGMANGGWKMKVIDSNGKWADTYTDYFGRKSATFDQGYHGTNYQYDQAGHLVSQVGVNNTTWYADFYQNISYQYRIDGKLARIDDIASGVATRYAYDANGNQTEVVVEADVAAGQQRRVYSITAMRYDSHNRQIGLSSADASITTEYDARGNIRHKVSKFRQERDPSEGSAVATDRIEDDWYDYDGQNRMVYSMAERGATGYMYIGSRGVQIAYDSVGRRSQVTYGANALNDGTWSQSTERYYYLNNDQIKAVATNRNGASLYARRTYALESWSRELITRQREYDNAAVSVAGDLVTGTGRLIRDSATRFNVPGLQTVQQVWTYSYNTAAGHTGEMHDIQYNQTSNYYDSAGVLTGASGSSYLNMLNGSAYLISDTQTTYSNAFYDSAQVASSTTTTTRRMNDNSALPDQTMGTPYQTTVNVFDANGRVKQTINSSSASGSAGSQSYYNTIHHWRDSKGNLVRTDQFDSTHDTLAGAADRSAHRYTRNVLADSVVVGTVTNEGPLQRQYNVDLVHPDPDCDDPTFNVFTADNAADFDQNYQAVAQSNGPAFGFAYRVREGDTLASVAQALWGNADAWYRLAEANGMSHSAALTAGTVLQVPDRIVAANTANNSHTTRPYVSGHSIGGTQAGPVGTGACGQATETIARALVTVAMVLISVAVAVVSAVLAPTGMGILAAAAWGAASGAVSGALLGAAGVIVGNVVSRELGLTKEEINWSKVGMAALEGGVKGAVSGAIGGGLSAGFGSAGLNLAKELPALALPLNALTGMLSSAAATAVGAIFQQKNVWDEVKQDLLENGVRSLVGGAINMGAAKSPLANVIASGAANFAIDEIFHPKTNDSAGAAMLRLFGDLAAAGGAEIAGAIRADREQAAQQRKQEQQAQAAQRSWQSSLELEQAMVGVQRSSADLHALAERYQREADAPAGVVLDHSPNLSLNLGGDGLAQPAGTGATDLSLGIDTRARTFARSGEGVYAVAARLGVGAAELMAANPQLRTGRLALGQSLLIPEPGAASEADIAAGSGRIRAGERQAAAHQAQRAAQAQARNARARADMISLASGPRGDFIASLKGSAGPAASFLAAADPLDGGMCVVPPKQHWSEVAKTAITVGGKAFLVAGARTVVEPLAQVHDIAVLYAAATYNSFAGAINEVTGKYTVQIRDPDLYSITAERYQNGTSGWRLFAESVAFAATAGLGYYAQTLRAAALASGATGAALDAALVTSRVVGGAASGLGYGMMAAGAGEAGYQLYEKWDGLSPDERTAGVAELIGGTAGGYVGGKIQGKLPGKLATFGAAFGSAWRAGPAARTGSAGGAPLPRSAALSETLFEGIGTLEPAAPLVPESFAKPAPTLGEVLFKGSPAAKPVPPLVPESFAAASPPLADVLTQTPQPNYGTLPGQRVFYVAPREAIPGAVEVGNKYGGVTTYAPDAASGKYRVVHPVRTAAVRTDHNVIGFDSQADGDFVRLAVERAQAAHPDASFTLGSYTHGTNSGEFGTPRLAEPLFGAEDVRNMAALKGGGPKVVEDVTTAAGRERYEIAEQLAQKAPLGKRFAVRTWCNGSGSQVGEPILFSGAAAEPVAMPAMPDGMALPALPPGLTQTRSAPGLRGGPGAAAAGGRAAPSIRDYASAFGLVGAPQAGPSVRFKYGGNGEIYGLLPAPSNAAVDRFQLVVGGGGRSRRDLYLGSNPGRDSAVGLLVQQRMRDRGALIGTGEGRMIQGRDGSWSPLADADMGHIVAGVDYWNYEGKFYGARAPEVVAFNHDPRNYWLEPAGQNRSDGASMGRQYAPPASPKERDMYMRFTAPYRQEAQQAKDFRLVDLLKGLK